MENEKWSWFAGGVVIGLLLGLGIAGSFAFTQAQRAQEAEVEARMQAEMAREMEVHARREADEARRHAEAAQRRAEESLQKLRKQQGDKGP